MSLRLRTNPSQNKQSTAQPQKNLAADSSHTPTSSNRPPAQRLPKPTQEIIDAIDPGKHVTKDASPSFIYSTGGDMSVDPLNASVFYEALKRAGVPVELHIFQLGPHGTGMAQTLKPELKELAVWPLLLENWMRQNGWISDGK